MSGSFENNNYNNKFNNLEQQQQQHYNPHIDKGENKNIIYNDDSSRFNFSGIEESYQQRNEIKYGNYKHPLENTWALWFFDNKPVEEWDENLSLINHFSNVEDFWMMYNEVISASEMKFGQGFGLFKKDILPMWEDKNNAQGGRWVLHLEKSQNMNDLDVIWLETILCLIGQTFGIFGDDICGATILSRPKVDKLSIWTRNAKNADVVLEIGCMMKQAFGFEDNVTISYHSHEMALNHQPKITYSV